MADNSAIGWTDATWNPTTGCSRVSEGCRNCYAAALAPRLAAMGQRGYTALEWTAANAGENVFTHPDRIGKPLRWRKPRRVFVNSMSDLWHERVPEEFIDRVFAVMALAGAHTFQVLTKRPERMRNYLNDARRRGLVDQLAFETARDELRADPDARNWSTISWPLPNVWVGTSVENQRAAEERIPHLLAAPAAVRFLSCEPLLEEVSLRSVAHTCAYSGEPMAFDALSEDVDAGLYFESHRDGYDERDDLPRCPRVNWVIAGGESGAGHRELNPDWARRLRDDCAEARVPFYFKQHSGARPESDTVLDGEEIRQFPATGATA